MKHFREVAIVILWFLLLYRVVTSLGDLTDAQLILLALFAWLGGLVTNELIRVCINIWRSRYHEQDTE